MVTAHTGEPNEVEAINTVAGDGPGATLDTVAPPEPAPRSKPWPWLLGGVAIGLTIGMARPRSPLAGSHGESRR